MISEKYPYYCSYNTSMFDDDNDILITGLIWQVSLFDRTEFLG